MAETLLTAVNRTLIQAGVVQTAMTTLVSQSQQQDVDACVGAINECVDQLMQMGVWPADIASGTITLVAGTRAYAFATDFVELADEFLIDETYGQALRPWPGGYIELRKWQLIPANFTGQAQFYVIEPITGYVYLASIPTAAEAGRVYKYIYKKETSFTTGTPTGTFPVRDECVRMMAPALLQLFYRDTRMPGYKPGELEKGLSLAASALSQKPVRKRYGPDERV